MAEAGGRLPVPERNTVTGVQLAIALHADQRGFAARSQGSPDVGGSLLVPGRGRGVAGPVGMPGFDLGPGVLRGLIAVACDDHIEAAETIDEVTDNPSRSRGAISSAAALQRRT